MFKYFSNRGNAAAIFTRGSTSMSYAASRAMTNLGFINTLPHQFANFHYSQHLLKYNNSNNNNNSNGGSTPAAKAAPRASRNTVTNKTKNYSKSNKNLATPSSRNNNNNPIMQKQQQQLPAKPQKPKQQIIEDEENEEEEEDEDFDEHDDIEETHNNKKRIEIKKTVSASNSVNKNQQQEQKSSVSNTNSNNKTNNNKNMKVQDKKNTEEKNNEDEEAETLEMFKNIQIIDAAITYPISYSHKPIDMGPTSPDAAQALDAGDVPKQRIAVSQANERECAQQLSKELNIPIVLKSSERDSVHYVTEEEALKTTEVNNETVNKESKIIPKYIVHISATHPIRIERLRKFLVNFCTITN